MTQVLMGLAAAFFCFLLLAVFQSRNQVKETSLVPAWKWCVISLLFWVMTCFATAFMSPDSPILDQWWYWSLILSLCPFISVLGAQRPTVRAWDYFVLIPLLAVMGWPAVTVLTTLPELSPLRVHAPVFIGFGIVLLMGCGNYLGTRYTVSVLQFGCSALLILSSFAVPVSTMETRMFLRTVGVTLLIIGVLSALRQAKRPTQKESAFDRIWFDFRDTFGIVWSIRIEDRINQVADQQKWFCRLGPHGFIWQEGITPDQRYETEQKLVQTLHWHFRRFVNPSWLDQRLSPLTARAISSPDQCPADPSEESSHSVSQT